jgi:hypothetical protein
MPLLRLRFLLDLMNSIRREDPELWERIQAFARHKFSPSGRSERPAVTEGEPLNTGIRTAGRQRVN